jgi:hypothetical protein
MRSRLMPMGQWAEANSTERQRQLMCCFMLGIELRTALGVLKARAGFQFST